MIVRICVLALAAGALTGCGEDELDRLVLSQGNGVLQNVVEFERRSDPGAAYSIAFIAPRVDGRVETITSRHRRDSGWSFVRHEIDCERSLQRETAAGRNVAEFISAGRAKPKWAPVWRASVADTVGSFACKKVGFRSSMLDAKVPVPQRIVASQNTDEAKPSEREQSIIAPTRLYRVAPTTKKRSGVGCQSTGAYGETSCITGRPKTVKVQAYRRKDGTYVKSHHRSGRRR